MAVVSIDGSYCRDFLVALSAAPRTLSMMQERTRASDPVLTLPAASGNKLPIKHQPCPWSGVVYLAIVLRPAVDYYTGSARRCCWKDGRRRLHLASLGFLAELT
jgi:hypothetical protein